ncbi:MAG: HIT family protein [Candidatus Moraniibacteriota bacterium]|nr:MAG: HIT family protein [Candidatus Moranbacteria bacterium]
MAIASHPDCLFCKFVNSQESCYKIWENDDHFAFLSIFPNTEGVCVVIPKKHLTSYIFDASDEEISSLMKASKFVAKALDKTFSDVGRTGVICEGFGIDHLHVKLFPMHGTGNMEKWHPIENNREEYYTTYPGFLSSHDAKRAENAFLKDVAKKIQGTLTGINEL